MDDIQNALSEVLRVYGTRDWKNRLTAKIALHHQETFSNLTLTTGRIICSLPFGSDISGKIKYTQKRVDQVWNLEVWMNA